MEKYKAKMEMEVVKTNEGVSRVSITGTMSEDDGPEYVLDNQEFLLTIIQMLTYIKSTMPDETTEKEVGNGSA